MNTIDAKNHPANKGLDFQFSGGISQEVLCNYLSRSIIYSDEERADYGLTGEETVRFILHLGAKYIGRANTKWSPSADDVAEIASRKAELATVHAADPDVVFEACIFECINKDDIPSIEIPAWVFTAFGRQPESRHFRYEDMIFADGRFLNQWGEDFSVPDMTREETQMLFYYRARLFIDAGYEGLHMGQVHLIGANDTDWKCWTKVLNMIRDYARVHARRKFVLINAHTHGIIDGDGLLMFDFHAFPMRLASPPGSVAHRPAEGDPQLAIVQAGNVDAIYGRSLGGKTHSGWSCNRLPYFVEFDNFGYCEGRVDTPDNLDHFIWGKDEISWYADQPKSYRREFVNYAYRTIRDLGDEGFLELPGRRNCPTRDAAGGFIKGYYAADNPRFYDKGCGDEEFLRDVWIADRQNRL